MATQAENSPPKPHIVGSAFVEQYYNLLAQSPEIVHKFYQENSVVSRPNSDGVMSSTTTLDGINTMILSLDSKNCGVQILSVDTQVSFGNGVIVLVTGYFTGKDDISKKFTQLFFLAPQDNSHDFGRYFVLNDLLRYEGEVGAANVDGTVSAVPVTHDQEASPVSDQPKLDQDATILVEENIQDQGSSQSLENGTVSTSNEVIATDPLVDATQDVKDIASEEAPFSVQDDAPKRSYASVANALNLRQEPFQQRASSAKPVQETHSAAASTTSPHSVASPRSTAPTHPPVATYPSGNNTVEKNNNNAVRGYSIFVANLPMDATEEHLRKAFEKFGPIKPGGIQVRSYTRDKNCFGFVEFESSNSMNKAVEAATIRIGNREAHIEEKKANNAGGNYPKKGGYRNDNYRGQRNFRNEFIDNQGGFKDHFQRNSRRNGEVNQKVNQNGGGRGVGFASTM